MNELATAIDGMKHWDWCPICRSVLDTGLECDQCGADLMPIYTALKESLSGGNPGEPNACTGAEERGISGATGAGQLPDGNPESTGDSADRRSPDGTARTPSPDESNRHFERGCHVIMELMQAYERRVRSDCTTQEQIDKRPWECAEYIKAAEYLRKVWPPHEPLPTHTAQVRCRKCGEKADIAIFDTGPIPSSDHMKLLEEAELELRHSSIFVRSREKMHPTGLDLYDDLLRRIQVYLGNPSTKGGAP